MKLRVRWHMIAPAIALFFVCLCACSDFGVGDEREGLKPTFYSMEISIDGGAATHRLNPPPFSGRSFFDTPAVTLESVNERVTLEVVSVNVVGNEVHVTFRVTNDGNETIERVWLIAQSQTGGVSVMPSSADGYIGEGNYYFLQNLGVDETSGDITVMLDNAYGAGEITVWLDVVSVGDRIVFQYIIPGGSSETWSSSVDGSETAAVVSTGDYSFSPITSPDGGWIAFSWGHPSEADIGLARADGGGAVRLTCFPEGYLLPGGFTKDGKKIYVRYVDPALGAADVYLLDILTALQDCSSDASLTPLTTGDDRSESLPVSFPDGRHVLYGRRVDEEVPPPYPKGDPNPYAGSCPDWVHGTEGKILKFNLYLKPTDPATGTSTGNEMTFWDQTLAQGGISVAPDSKGVLFKGGGCLIYSYHCRCNYTDESVDCDGQTVYEYRVSAVDADGESDLSSPATVTCGRVQSKPSPVSSKVSSSNDGEKTVRNREGIFSFKPNKPAAPTATGTDINVRLSWPAVESTSNVVDHYKVYRDGLVIDTVPSCQWKVVCDRSFPTRLFRLEAPSDPASAPLPYEYLDPGVKQGDEFKTYVNFKDYYDPWKCGQTGRVVFTSFKHHVGDADCTWGDSAPPGVCDDHRILIDMKGIKTDAHCTPAVYDR